MIFAKIIFFFILSIISAKKPLIGLIILIVLNCTFNLPLDFFSLNFSIGYIFLSDVILLAMLGKYLFFEKSNNKDKLIGLLKIITIWLILCAIVTSITGITSYNDAYRLVFRFGGIIWLIPLLVREFNEKEKRILIKSLVLLSFLIFTVQYLLLIVPNASTIATLYYQFNVYSNPDLAAAVSISQGTPRLYPQGALLVQMMLGFLLTQVIIKEKYILKNNIITYLGLIASSLFTFSLGGRSNIIAFIIMLCIATLILRKYNPIAMRKIFFVIPFLLSVFLILSTAYNFTIIPDLTEKANLLYSDKDYNLFINRLSDDAEAFTALLKNPILGLGKTNVGKSEFGTGNDIHGILALGLEGGIIAILLFIIFLYNLIKRVLSYRRSTWLRNNRFFLPSIIALIPAIVLLLLNTTPAIIGIQHLIPFGIFTGLTLTNQKSLINK